MAYDENGLIVPDPIPASVVLGEAVVPQHPVLVQLQKQIEVLTGQRDSWKTDHDIMRDRWRERLNLENKLQNVLSTLVEEEEIEIDAAKTIAEIFDIVLTKTIDVELTVKVTASVEVPLGEGIEVDDVADNFSLSVDYYGSGDLLESDYDIEDWSERS